VSGVDGVGFKIEGEDDSKSALRNIEGDTDFLNGK
jgi:hypothetical protein